MKLNVVNLVNVCVHLFVGIYSVNNTDRDVYLTIVPILIGIVFLSQNQAIQNETRVQVRAAAVIGLMAVALFMYKISLALHYEDDYGLIGACVLLSSNIIVVLLFVFFLIKKKRELKSLAPRS
jgi:hypothetical protein